MDANTLGWIIFASGITLTWIALKTTFFGIKLMAGVWWFIIFIYLKTNVPIPLTEGGALHTALLVISVGIGLMIVLAGLGRGIQRTTKWEQGTEQTEGFRFPKWMKFNNEDEESYASKHQKTEENNLNYRMQLKRAYRTDKPRR